MFDNYRVNWGDRAGYIKLAIRRRLPIVPVACAGADGAYIGLWNGEKMAARFGLSPKLGWATWGGLGLLGPYPLSPPIPVRMRQLIGEPIDVSHVDPGDRTAIARMHDEFTRRLQALLDRARNSKR